jgi:hypothetical protein
MKNNIKAGDKFTINATNFTNQYGSMYRDCTVDKQYTCLVSGTEAELLLFEPGEADVAFFDDTGDRVLTHFEHLSKV